MVFAVIQLALFGTVVQTSPDYLPTEDIMSYYFCAANLDCYANPPPTPLWTSETFQGLHQKVMVDPNSCPSLLRELEFDRHLALRHFDPGRRIQTRDDIELARFLLDHPKLRVMITRSRPSAWVYPSRIWINSNVERPGFYWEGQFVPWTVENIFRHELSHAADHDQAEKGELPEVQERSNDFGPRSLESRLRTSVSGPDPVALWMEFRANLRALDGNLRAAFERTKQSYPSKWAEFLRRFPSAEHWTPLQVFLVLRAYAVEKPWAAMYLKWKASEYREYFIPVEVRLNELFAKRWPATETYWMIRDILAKSEFGEEAQR